MNFSEFLNLEKIIEMAALIAALAGISAAIIMKKVTSHFGTGIVATGYRYSAAGVALISLAMLIEAVLKYLQIQGGVFALTKEILLVLGTYTIVIGTKITADKLDNLTGKKE
ncbi:MAG: hypothetical protein Q8P89_03530 [bacterium]|nr:hypothetical protein [bacterium]